MPTSLFTPIQPRPCRVYFMLLGSVIFHGLLVGAAYLWPYSPAVAGGPGIVELSSMTDQSGPEIVDLPASTPSVAAPEPPTSPLTPVDPLVEDTPPPPTLVPDIFEPTTSPLTPAAHRTAVPATSRPIHVAHPSGQSRLAGAGPANAQAGTGAAPGLIRSNLSSAWRMPKPPYPYAMRAARVQGSGTIRVTTDSAGRVVEAIVIQSTGHSSLDDNTCRYARGNWNGPPNASTIVPITYQLP